MLNNIIMTKSKLAKVMHTILFILTGLYLLETILFTGYFGVVLACINIILGVVALVIAIIKNERKLALIDLAIILGTLAIFMFLMQL
ncbi:hypothetical protein R0131_03285 [Clostridium sp. AL.422]|uniref:hypothetical protein n=1 Tax=Clostridium TaxID=1485 RepID=UPI00293DAA22|nr:MULTISPECIES: hypothetical protein [unclassified Clostridium]MDV4149849.1 hypothetical protein [Clostridium sp. AL.422]